MKITEEMKLQDEWYKEAKQQTLKTLPTFMEKLATNLKKYFESKL